MRLLVVVRLVLVVVSLMVIAGSARADEPGAKPPAAASGGKAFDPVAATEAYLSKLPPEARAKSDAYFEGGYWLHLWGFLVSSAVLLLLLVTGVSTKMRQASERLVPWRWLQPALYGAIFVLITGLLELPLSVYGGYFREHQYGLSNQTLGAWATDQAKGLGLGLVFGAIAIVVLYAILRRVHRAWWLWASGAAMAGLFVLLLIGPVYLAPIFNTYKPLDDPAVRDPILSLARANQIPADNVYVFDASKQTSRVSANVSGVLGTTRISLNDNLIKRCSLAAVQAVMGHEMGHYVMNHIYKGMMEFGLLLTVGFGLCAWAIDRVLKAKGAAWGIDSISDPAGLPLLALLLGVFFFVATPVSNTIIRTQEIEADQFGLNAARQPDGFAEAALILSEYRKIRPGKWEEIIFYDHPSGYNRILMAMRWKAENLNAPDFVGR